MAKLGYTYALIGARYTVRTANPVNQPREGDGRSLDPGIDD
jgi:hypothetical protein